MLTYKYKLYKNRKDNAVLHAIIDSHAEVWNHYAALQRRYYRRYGGYITYNRMSSHCTKLKKLEKYSSWKLLPSQSIQNLLKRLDQGYQLFFKNQALRKKGGKRRVGIPKFKSMKKYKSFTLLYAGFKFHNNGRIDIKGITYKYHNKERVAEGKVKLVTIKRNKLGELFFFVVTDHIRLEDQDLTGNEAGFDFGLKTFLVGSDGRVIKRKEFLKLELRRLRQLSKIHSRTRKGKRDKDPSKRVAPSKNRERARLNLARLHEKITNKRDDRDKKLARKMAMYYDTIVLEDLNLDGMKKLWGRKISDLGFGLFIKHLESMCNIYGSDLIFISRWFPSTKTCNTCKTVNRLITLNDREWICPSCRTTHDRDSNASKNIYEEGMKLRSKD